MCVPLHLQVLAQLCRKCFANMADRWLNAAPLAQHDEAADESSLGSKSGAAPPSVDRVDSVVGGAVAARRRSFSSPPGGCSIVPRFSFSLLRLQLDIQLQNVCRRLSELEENDAHDHGDIGQIGQPGIYNTYYHDLLDLQGRLQSMIRTVNDLRDLHYVTERS